jgi:hypothetical protein
MRGKTLPGTTYPGNIVAFISTTSWWLYPNNLYLFDIKPISSLEFKSHSFQSLYEASPHSFITPSVSQTLQGVHLNRLPPSRSGFYLSLPTRAASVRLSTGSMSNQTAS